MLTGLDVEVKELIRLVEKGLARLEEKGLVGLEEKGLARLEEKELDLRFALDSNDIDVAAPFVQARQLKRTGMARVKWLDWSCSNLDHLGLVPGSRHSTNCCRWGCNDSLQ